MNDSADPFDGELVWMGLRRMLSLLAIGGRRRFLVNVRGIAHAIVTRDSDWAPLACGCVELLDEPPVPAWWQADILMQTDEEIVPGAGDAQVQAVGCVLTVFEQDHFVD